MNKNEKIYIAGHRGMVGSAVWRALEKKGYDIKKPSQDEFDKALAEVDKYCKAGKRDYEIIEVVKCGQQSPRTYRICVDFIVK